MGYSLLCRLYVFIDDRNWNGLLPDTNATDKLISASEPLTNIQTVI